MANTPAPAEKKPREDHFVGADAVARVYAKALIGAAGKDLPSVLAEIDSFLDDVLPSSPHLAAIMQSGMVSPEAKVGMIDKVFTGRASTLFISFLKVVAEHGRGNCLPALRRVVREMPRRGTSEGWSPSRLP